jgi:hypothetical protein
MRTSYGGFGGSWWVVFDPTEFENVCVCRRVWPTWLVWWVLFPLPHARVTVCVTSMVVIPPHTDVLKVQWTHIDPTEPTEPTRDCPVGGVSVIVLN